MEPNPINERDADMLLEFVRLYQAATPWQKFQLQARLRVMAIKHRMPARLHKLNGKHAAGLVLVLGLALYLAIGGAVDYSPELVQVLASAGAIGGAALGKTIT
jgi:hypothetical protein